MGSTFKIEDLADRSERGSGISKDAAWICTGRPRPAAARMGHGEVWSLWSLTPPCLKPLAPSLSGSCNHRRCAGVSERFVAIVTMLDPRFGDVVCHVHRMHASFSVIGDTLTCAVNTNAGAPAQESVPCSGRTAGLGTRQVASSLTCQPAIVSSTTSARMLWKPNLRFTGKGASGSRATSAPAPARWAGRPRPPSGASRPASGQPATR